MKIVVNLFALIVLVAISAAVANAVINFHGMTWNGNSAYARAYAPSGYSGLQTVTFYNAKWECDRWWDSTASAMWVTGTYDSLTHSGDTLHLRFYRGLNKYYYNIADTNATPDSIRQFYNTLTNYYNNDIMDPLRRIYFVEDSLMLAAMGREYVWYQCDIRSIDFLRYGKFRWDVRANFLSDLNGYLHPGLWIWHDDSINTSATPDDTIYSNWQQAQNEIDFEFGGWSQQLGGWTDQSGWMNTAVQPWTGPDAGNWAWWPERGRNLPIQDGSSTHEITYLPESIRFFSYWDTTGTDTSWTFPDPLNPTPRRGYINNAGWGGLASGKPEPIRTDSLILVPRCGIGNRARIDLLDKLLGTAEYDDGDSFEMVVTNFTWTGIPDLSFRDTVGGPWPWATGEWHPSGWHKSMMVTTDSNVTTTTINSTHSCDTIRYGERAWVYWGVRNVGTATIPPNEGISTSFYDNDELLFTRQRLDSLAIGATLYDSVQLSLEPGNHWLKLITGVEYGGSSLEELRKSNNADSIKINVTVQDASLKNTDGSGLSLQRGAHCTEAKVTVMGTRCLYFSLFTDSIGRTHCM
ncbi:MAG: hypothetical protein OEM52_00315 [bacterium]|nr:hypothetical protein [bacterium]